MQILTGYAARAEIATYGTVTHPANMQSAPEENLAYEGCDVSPKTQFETGRVYATRSLCDHDCIFRWKVIRRTEKSVWLAECRADGTVWGDVTRRAISFSSYAAATEMCYPSGRYSMCPIITAEDGEL